VYGQAGPATPAQPQLIPMGEGWAPGVGGVPVTPKSRRLRWGIALGFVAIVAVVGAAGAFVLSGASGAGQSLTAAYAPKDTLSFTVLRTDLPGDQHQNLADFMSHFPGFGDRALFDTAIDNELNQLVSKISPDLTYSSGFKPWMQGEISIVATSLGTIGASAISQSVGSGGLDAGALQNGVASGAAPNVVAIVALKDKTAAEAFVSSEVARSGHTFTSSSYAGATIYTATVSGTAAAYAFTDNVLLLGTPDAVKASLDAKSKGSLSSDANYQAAMKSLSGDSISVFYVAESALLKGEMAAVPASSALPQDEINFLLDNVPAWTAGEVRAESDHLLVETTMPRPAISPTPGNHVSTLASVVPASTVAILDIHSIGEIATSVLDNLSAQSAPSALRDQIKNVKSAIAGFGGLDWLGDGAVVVTKNGSTFDGGLVVQTTDAGTASDKVGLLKTLVGASGGSGVSTQDETYNGVTITTYQVGESGLESGIIAGTDSSFVKSVIDTTAGSSLASSDTYKTALAAAGTSNAGSAYIDVPTLVAALGAELSASDPSYDANIKPYLDHVGGAAFADIDGSTITVRFIVMAK
jgi:hypothetical protein